MSTPEPEYDRCINALDTWLQSKKKSIYDENIKGPDNSEDVLESYINSLEDLGINLIRAINNQDIDTLGSLEWPEELLECIEDMNIRIVINDRIEYWCIRYPFIKSILHINEMVQENAGVN